MLTHKQVWDAIDRLAERYHLSASGLAKRAGLDPTTFNKSKRITKQGKPRWPSTESVAKVLEATGADMLEYVSLMDGAKTKPSGGRLRLRSLAFGQLNKLSALDSSGFPMGSAWEEVEFPALDDEHAYILELDNETTGLPYRIGDMAVISPGSSIRRGDRVLARMRDGSFMFVTFARKTSQRVVFAGSEPEATEIIVDADKLQWMARIVWVSQ